MHRSSVTRRSSTSKVAVDFPWTKTVDDVTSSYKVDLSKGLTEERARADLERYGPNGNHLSTSSLRTNS